jgi:hypothetical protein
VHAQPPARVEITYEMTRNGSPMAEIIERLEHASLVMKAEDAGIQGGGYVIPEVGRLLDFLEFLELKEKFGRV